MSKNLKTVCTAGKAGNLDMIYERPASVDFNEIQLKRNTTI